jgi:hypothetical protein
MKLLLLRDFLKELSKISLPENLRKSRTLTAVEKEPITLSNITS